MPRRSAPGTAFLSNQDIVRGFKVHASVVDPLAVPLVAQDIDIETAAYSGTISAPSSSGFTYTHNFLRAIDDYSVTLPYIAAATRQRQRSGHAAMPSPATSGGTSPSRRWLIQVPTRSSDFVSATNGTASFGGTAGAIVPWGVSYVVWGDPANATRLERGRARFSNPHRCRSARWPARRWPA